MMKLDPIQVHVIRTTESSGAKFRDNGYVALIEALLTLTEIKFERHLALLWRMGNRNR